MKQSNKHTTTLLTCGLLAGPLYIVVGAAQILARPGFDMTRHPLSMMSLGDLGWIQMANFFVAGSLTILGALGLRRIRNADKRWKRGAIGVGLFGAGVVGAGFFKVDPSLGFPPGTPDVAPTVMSWHATLHLFIGQLAFLSLIVASFIFARYFAAAHRRGWAALSVFTGSFFLLAIAATAMAQGAAWASLALYAAIVLSWLWLSAVISYGLRIDR